MTSKSGRYGDDGNRADRSGRGRLHIGEGWAAKFEFGGASRNRTDVQGFAILCMTTLPSRQTYDAEARLQAVYIIVKTYSCRSYPLVLPPGSAWPLRNHSYLATRNSALPPQTGHRARIV